jgi:NAD(P)H dehydrogenase (quinone)
MPTKLLVTGAAGKLGRRVVELLLEKKAGEVIAATRKPEALKDLVAKGVRVVKADFEQPASLAAAFEGVERALLISTDAIGRRIEQHRAAVSAFAKAGVKHIVYTSMPNPGPESPVTIAPEHRATEELILATQLGFTLLRNNLYTDLMLATLPAAVKSGQLVDARGNGSAAFVTREDCAQAAAAALAKGDGKQTLDVTGPEALSSAQLADILSELTGRPVKHLSVSPDALIEGMLQHGLPKVAAELYASFDAAIVKGQLAKATDTVKKLSGKAPQSVKAFLTANRALLG